jgi:hypothetical protein
MAAIQGLVALKEPCQVEVTIDAEYLRQGITLWVARWKRRHWWHKKHPVRNADLWIELDELVAMHKTTWSWTRVMLPMTTTTAAIGSPKMRPGCKSVRGPIVASMITCSAGWVPDTSRPSHNPDCSKIPTLLTKTTIPILD